MKFWYIFRKTVSYICALLLCVLIGLLVQSCSTETLTINVDVENDRDLNEHLVGYSLNGYDFQHKNKDADILICESSNKTIDGYKKLEKALTSTIVLMFDNQITNYNSGFSQITSNCYRADLTSMLVAIENGESWETLGVSKNVATGEVSLVIPSENCSYYDEVVETIYYALNNFKPLTNEQREILKPRVDAILNKCEKVPNVMQAIIDSCSKDDKKVMLGPEYLCRSNGGTQYFGTGYDSYYMVYLNEYITFTADIYLNQNVNETKASFLRDFENKILQKSDFASQIGWRVTDAEYDIQSNLRSFMYSNIN